MSLPIRVSVRNCDGEHLFTIDTPEELEAYEFRAECGELNRFEVRKKGKTAIIFKLKAPELRHPDPSKSPDSACELTPSDMVGLATRHWPEERTSRHQIERWIGHGLIPVRA